MDWLTNTPLLTKERGFLSLNDEVAGDFIPILIKHKMRRLSKSGKDKKE